MDTNVLGWIGTILSLIFYLALSFKSIKIAYVALIFSALVWGMVGYLTDLPSLTFKEVAILFMTLLGWRNWNKK